MNAAFAPIRTHAAKVSRGQLFAGVTLLLLANGMTLRIVRSVEETGLGPALLATFQISALVWIAAAAAIALLLRSAEPPTRRDSFVVAAGAAAAMLPLSQLSWLALTGIALHMVLAPSPAGDNHPRRAGQILLAITGAMFWGRLLLQAGGDAVLRADALLVGFITGMPTDGNLVAMANDAGWLWIAPYCSSLTNMSLAILCAVTVTAWNGLAWGRGQLSRCAGACAAVVALNDLRVALLVWWPEHYDLIHGPFGSNLVSWLTIGAVLLICVAGNTKARDAAA